MAHSPCSAHSPAFLIVVKWQWSYWAAYLIIPPAIGLVAAAVEFLILRPLRRADMFTVVIATVFLGIALSEGFRLTYNTELLAVPALFAGAPFIVGGVFITRDTLVGDRRRVGGGRGAASSMFRYGRLGRGMRAMASNIRGAQLCGYSIDRVYMLAWFLGGALAGLTGVFIAPGHRGLGRTFDRSHHCRLCRRRHRRFRQPERRDPRRPAARRSPRACRRLTSPAP